MLAPEWFSAISFLRVARQEEIMAAHQGELPYEDAERLPAPVQANRSRSTLWLVLALLAAIAAAALVWLFAPLREPPMTAPPASAETPLDRGHAVAPAPATPAPFEGTPVASEPAEPLPSLRESDPFARSAIESVVGHSGMGLFYPEEVIRRWVATIDNLPRHASLWPLSPVRAPSGAFAVEMTDHGPVVAATNPARYRVYAALLDRTPATLIVSTYRRLYPLLQQQYESLGFPGRQFNERVIAVLDDLLETPETSGSLALASGRVMYEFADPDLEERSAGQKLMLRIGPENARAVKTKLREIRRLIGPRAAP